MRFQLKFELEGWGEFLQAQMEGGEWDGIDILQCQILSVLGKYRLSE